MAQLKSFHFGAQPEAAAEAGAEAEAKVGALDGAGACNCCSGIDFFYSSAGATKY